MNEWTLTITHSPNGIHLCISHSPFCLLASLVIVLPRSSSYSQETPYRFRREVLLACQQNDRIELNKVQGVLRNIGAEERLSTAELQVMFDELGDTSNSMSTERLRDLL